MNNYITGGENPQERQARINEAARYFDLLFGAVREQKYSYLWSKRGEEKVTSPFDVSTPDNRRAMAQKAIELNDAGFDVYVGVNLTDVPCNENSRAKTEDISTVVATITDIDTEGGTHISNDKKKYPPTFDVAKSFLPFPLSSIVDSGYGLHGAAIFNTPLAIDDSNRKEAIARNKKFLEVIRSKAGNFAGAVDSIGDLPRVLRVPGTRNYKLGISADAPLCHIVDVADVRFDPADLDTKLNALLPAATQKTSQPARASCIYHADDNPDLKEFRIRRMLDFISPSSLTYDEWLAVGIALFNEGFDCGVWEQWSRADNRFKDGECEAKWKTFHYDATGKKIGTLYQYAVEGGYDEKETYREFCRLHPEHVKKHLSAAQVEVKSALADFDKEKDEAIEKLRSVETFNSDTVFKPEIINAAAFAYIFAKKDFSNFKRDVREYGDKHKDEKAAVNVWLADVKNKAAEIQKHRSELVSQKNEIDAQIKSREFLANNSELANFEIPPGYAVTAERGIEKVAGEDVITVCRRPVFISGKTYCADEKIYKLALSFMTPRGKWKKLSPTEKAVIFNKNKIVDLANSDFPVTTSNAKLLVDYLDAFNAENESALPLTYLVNRCGWYHVKGTDLFIDPRRKSFFIQDDGEKIPVEVDEGRSDFAKHLKEHGEIEKWKDAYKRAKKSPVARFIVAAAVAPFLLHILGERNFLLYIVAPTRAGKTTALLLGASAIGSEKIIRTFDATKNGLAGAAADVNDYAFLIDEKQVADNRLKETFDTLVYALANGLGRTKLNRDSSLKKMRDWRTIAIMTGETQMLADNVTAGAFTRLLTFKAPKVILLADDCKVIRDTVKDNNGLVLPLVIDKVKELGEEKLRGVYRELVDFFTKTYPALLPEYCRYMAIITLADTLLNSALFGNTVTTDNNKKLTALEDATLCAKKIFELIPTRVEIDDTPREKEFVLSFIAQNQPCFINGTKENKYMPAVFGKLCDDDDSFTYITLKALKDACDRAGFDYRKLVADLVADGFFMPADKTEKGHKTPLATVQHKIGKTNTRCYRIPKKELDGGGD